MRESSTMRRIAFLIILLVATSLRAAEDGPAAGIILYSETPEGIQLLLADHAAPSQRGWAAFGGHHEVGETAAQTAARETEEETRGYYKRDTLLKAIKGKSPFFDGPFAFYFVRVDYVDPAEIATHPVPSNSSYFLERGPYAWVPYSELERFFDPETVTFPLTINSKYLPGDRNTDWVWPLWLHNLAGIAGRDQLPWASKKSAAAH